MNKATESLIEAMKATKRGDDCEEAQDLHNAFRCSVETDNRCALDLNAILEALMEIVVGEKCVAVPVREVEAIRAVWNRVPYTGVELTKACNAIMDRLPNPKPNHLEELREIHSESIRRRAMAQQGSDLVQHMNARIAALEAAIKRMEQP